MSTAISITLVLSVLVFLCDSTSGQSRTRAGGYSDYSPPSNSPSFNAVVRVANKYLADNGHVGRRCSNSGLRPTRVQQQVVAGTNYRLSYQIPSRCSANGAAVSCTVVVYQPLPYTKLPPSATGITCVA